MNTSGQSRRSLRPRGAVIFVCLVCTAAVGAGQTPGYRFSTAYSSVELMANDALAEQFSLEFARSVGRTFHQPGVAYDDMTGITLDGHPIDFESGGKLGVRRDWTAASKEAPHICLLALALQNGASANAVARAFVSPDNPDQAPVKAKELLEKKLLALEDFAGRNPGYGNWLPWVKVGARYVDYHWMYGLTEAGGWRGKLPALDNGEFAWAFVMAEGMARTAGEPELADRLKAYVDRLKQTAALVFFEPSNNLVRGVSLVTVPALLPDDPAQEYRLEGDFCLGDGCEGELMELFITLYGSVSSNQVDALWAFKQTNTNICRSAIDLTAGTSPFTIEQGFRFSPHELWARLQFPYLDDPRLRRLFVNGEKARTHYSASHLIPGLMAAAALPSARNVTNQYENRYGIPEAGRDSAGTISTAVSPYAAFSTILADRCAGSSWLDVMLDAHRGQGPCGVSDSLSLDGSGFGPIVTCDGNLLLVLAYAVEEEYRHHGQHPMRDIIGDSLYQAASGRLTTLYSNAFPALYQSGGALAGEELPFASPAVVVPPQLADFPNLAAPAPGDVLDGTGFTCSTGFVVAYTPAQSLAIPATNGFCFAMFQQINGNQVRYLNLDADSPTGSDFWIELKDGDDHVRHRFQAHLPPSSGYAGWVLPLPTQSGTSPAPLGLLAIGDPTGPVTFRSLQVTSNAGPGNVMAYDGLGFYTDEPPVVAHTNLLTQAVFEGGGNLSLGYSFTNSILTLPKDDGYVFTAHPDANLLATPWLVFSVKTAGGGLFLENKNRGDQLITPNKVRVDFPSTQGEFQYCALDMAKPPKAPGDLLVRLLVFSDTETNFQFNDIHYAAQAPTNGVELAWDGRRFACQPPRHYVEVPFRDLMWEMNLSNRELNMSYGNILSLRNGGGFAFGFTSPFDLLNAEHAPFFNLVVRTEAPASLYVEIKGNNGGFVGQLIYGYYKLHVAVPDTGGEFRMITVPLADQFVPAVHDRFVRQLAFSDVSGFLDIAAIGLTASIPSDLPCASLKVDSEGVVLFTGYGGRAEMTTNLLSGWQVISNYVPPYCVEDAGKHFFAIRDENQ